MEMMRFGKTNLKVNKLGFGALPIQRASEEDAIEILKKAYENGVNFYDTARSYTDSEHKLSLFFEDKREEVYIASKTMAENGEELWKDLETSLKELKTDYIDLYQLHNPDFCPKPNDGSGLYDALVDAKEEGIINHIGISSHKLDVANEALDSGLYETMQFPFSYLTGKKELEIVERCKELDVGFLAMKALAGGLICNPKAAYAFMNQYDNVLPIWGIQRLSELDEFLAYSKEDISLDESLKGDISMDKLMLGGDFCRGCDYCLPCLQDIDISTCIRMSLWIRRFPSEPCLTEEYQEKMEQTLDCKECRVCSQRCPYHLNVPKLLKQNYEDYQNILSGKTKL